jgi:hypothetical protein
MKAKILSLLFFNVSLAILQGCATLLGPKLHPLSASSDPVGADVYVNGFNMGLTPIQLNLSADKSYVIEFKKVGYHSVTRVVNTRVGAGWVVLDVVAGLVPVIIDAATGAWNKLDQQAVNAVLEKQLN